MIITDISYIDIRVCNSCMIFVTIPHGGPFSQWTLTPVWKHKGKNHLLTIHYCRVSWGKQKISALNIKRKECFHKAQTVCHIHKEYSDSRLIMFSINCFILLGNVPPYSGSVFPSISQHVGSCKSFVSSDSSKKPIQKLNYKRWSYKKNIFSLNGKCSGPPKSQPLSLLLKLHLFLVVEQLYASGTILSHPIPQTLLCFNEALLKRQTAGWILSMKCHLLIPKE